MASVYILKGTGGRHYIGASGDVEARLARHNSGMVHSTKRLGLPLKLVACRAFDSMEEARWVEVRLKRWKSPGKAIAFLRGDDDDPVCNAGPDGENVSGRRREEGL
ncbi:MAG: GIY-YIG nuclease family protein [Akkermansiaceae bacterium]|nr:GIY-YIG nuclease family protein [Akkermansiaceae bacterium]